MVLNDHLSEIGESPPLAAIENGMGFCSMDYNAKNIAPGSLGSLFAETALWRFSPEPVEDLYTYAGSSAKLLLDYGIF